MIIEFFGLPGAGKSYLAKRMAQEKDYKVVTFSGKYEKYFHALCFIIFHPRHFFFLFKNLFVENKKNKKLLNHKIKRLFVRCIAVEQKARWKKNSIIDEQGFFQFILSIYERQITSKEVSQYYKYLKKSKYFVYIIEAEQAKRKERMSIRKRVPRQKIFGENYAENWLYIAEYNFFVLAEFVKENFNHQVINNN